jgi:hypothetical protein
MSSSADLTDQIVRVASREGLALHRAYGRMPSLTRLVEAVLAAKEPWLEQIRGDQRGQVTTILRNHLERHGCTTALGRRRRRKR